MSLGNDDAPDKITAERLRRSCARAALLVAIAILIGLLGHIKSAIVLTILAICLTGSAVFAPHVFDRLDSFVAVATGCVGTLLAWIVLVPFFFLVITPAGIVRRALRGDILNLTFPARSQSLWRPKSARGDEPESYRRQF